jgi:hypothetical protein
VSLAAYGEMVKIFQVSSEKEMLIDDIYLVQLDDPTPPEQLPCTVHTLVRPLDRFPANFEVQARSNGKGVISPMKNERMLLNSLLGSILLQIN